ncbi:hypothetical protein [Marinicrinis sediminis]|uniref:Uncharacterized protein n=1 Tax=Marinicrinis sediminis TaxID=1652465 RepID=A0ABW5R681_9BACL
MELHIDIFKRGEDSEYMIYEFGPNHNQLGKVKINRETREYTMINEVPGGYTNIYCAQALFKIFKIYDSEKEFPEYTFFSSGR